MTEEEHKLKANEELNQALAKCGTSVGERKKVYEKHVKDEVKR